MNKTAINKFLIIAAAATGLMFAGCAKHDTTDSTSSHGASSSNTSPGSPTVKPVQHSTVKPVSSALYFAFDSAGLDASGKTTLDGYVAWLNDHAGVSVTIEGNCDERGSREYNLALGQKRADSVKSYLVAHGVNDNRIDTVSFGEERPACKGSGEACWAQNRRADIVSR
ncbi:MAG: peptidoglycan-associated lipoprotein [Zetaproteobacteria bacterium CG_4_9_14_3_um_filter_49_83]|nr:MAG: peptidoglycan-associated lipoprotein [Zetaproteobacteria bacterium CG1_02_49_23]PIQ30723.1 MAG: peptidoglycan-associated lipoprotein [Zetaproteobacteria bacterium CG17_big_fil_post_rev_8_21_14_2_50_50_13]PIV30726.1 MAG: peptidoglycan-associated lipoprotein [Zetaproteobacteria bacterium CG02_land_8_20_14_3_00_50_9]PIY56846.1 MAG: peptidoglycan-associated lipoprotein [Zetaproteobacteria bacterium CG_4_10_14_0_8_um_filter_49_80]PJA35144.1 MAG: peptidoglycan-associated lipoprotein [Zetaprot